MLTSFLKRLAVIFLGLFLLASAPGAALATTEEDVRRVQAYVRQATEQIDQYLRQLEPSLHAGVWTMGFVEIMKAHPWVTYRHLEGRLRALNSNTFLIAAPSSTAPEGLCAQALLGIPPGPLPFYLWVAVNGAEEAREQLAAFGIQSAAENIENLAQTGLLMQIPPTTSP